MDYARGRLKYGALPRFFVEAGAISARQISFSPEQHHQLRRVLRLADGGRVIVCDGTGREIVAELQGMAARPVAVPLECRDGISEPSCNVSLFQSALRGDRFTWLLQKGTEIGVSHFAPVIFARTQPSDYAGRMTRFHVIVREAAEQCERSRLPAVDAPVLLATALQGSTVVRILLDEQEAGNSLRDAVPVAVDAVHVFIGPEGGLTTEERALARASGLISVTLGPRILRSETAGLVAATILLSMSHDLG